MADEEPLIIPIRFETSGAQRDLEQLEDRAKKGVSVPVRATGDAGAAGGNGNGSGAGQTPLPTQTAPPRQRATRAPSAGGNAGRFQDLINEAMARGDAYAANRIAQQAGAMGYEVVVPQVADDPYGMGPRTTRTQPVLRQGEDLRARANWQAAEFERQERVRRAQFSYVGPRSGASQNMPLPPGWTRDEEGRPLSPQQQQASAARDEMVRAAMQRTAEGNANAGRFDRNRDAASFAQFKEQNRNEQRFQNNLDRANLALQKAREREATAAERNARVETERNRRMEQLVGRRDFQADIAGMMPQQRRAAIEGRMQQLAAAGPMEAEVFSEYQALRREANALGPKTGMNRQVMSTGMFMNLLFGGMEVAHGLTGMAAASRFAAANPGDLAGQLKAQLQGIDQMAGGFMGSLAALPFSGMRGRIEEIVGSASAQDAHAEALGKYLAFAKSTAAGAYVAGGYNPNDPTQYEMRRRQIEVDRRKALDEARGQLNNLGVAGNEDIQKRRADIERRYHETMDDLQVVGPGGRPRPDVGQRMQEAEARRAAELNTLNIEEREIGRRRQAERERRLGEAAAPFDTQLRAIEDERSRQRQSAMMSSAANTVAAQGASYASKYDAQRLAIAAAERGGKMTAVQAATAMQNVDAEQRRDEQFGVARGSAALMAAQGMDYAARQRMIIAAVDARQMSQQEGDLQMAALRAGSDRAAGINVNQLGLQTVAIRYGMAAGPRATQAGADAARMERYRRANWNPDTYEFTDLDKSDPNYKKMFDARFKALDTEGEAANLNWNRQRALDLANDSAAQQRLNRNPVGADLTEIKGLLDANKIDRSQARLMAGTVLQQRLNQIQLLGINQGGRQAQLDALLNRDPYSAQVAGTVAQARAEEAQLRQAGFGAEADKARGLGADALRLQRQNYLDSFRGVSVSNAEAQFVAMFGNRGKPESADPAKVLANIDKGINDLGKPGTVAGGDVPGLLKQIRDMLDKNGQALANALVQ